MGKDVTGQADAVAQAFVSARREARALTGYPGERPADLAAAYVIQDRAIMLDGRQIVGWKVGKINPPTDALLGSNRLAGPIFADSVVTALAEESPAMPVFAGGFAAVEAEMLLHVAAGWDGTLPVDDAGTIALIDDVRLGIEIASSPYAGINADGPRVTVSDFGNNAGMIIGAPLEGWEAIDLCAIVVRTEIDGTVIGEATAATMLDGPYGAVRFLLANIAGRGFDTKDGLWISTGAITGVHPIAVGQSATAIFGDHGAVNCHIVAATGA